MIAQIHTLRTKLAQLPPSPLVDALGVMLDGFEEIDHQVGEFDFEVEVLHDENGDDSHWSERIGKVLDECERVLNQAVRTL